VDQDVVILEISVHDVERVQVLKAVQYLQANGPNDALVQGCEIGYLLQVGERPTIAVVEEEIVVFLSPLLVTQLDDVRVVTQLEVPDLRFEVLHGPLLLHDLQ
jgi:hypothetical protein